jgi:nitrogen regulatory protein P-II 1
MGSYATGTAKQFCAGGITVKRIVAIIQPFKIEDVEEAVMEIGVSGMTITEVRGFGRQGGHTETYRGSDYVVDFRPKLQLEIVVESERADEVIEAVEAILSATRSGNAGDGKIFVEEVESVVQIRTGTRGIAAL